MTISRRRRLLISLALPPPVRGRSTGRAAMHCRPRDSAEPQDEYLGQNAFTKRLPQPDERCRGFTVQIFQRFLADGSERAKAIQIRYTAPISFSAVNSSA